MGADDAGFKVDAAGLVIDAASGPAFAQADQHRVRHGLPREAGSGGAEGHGDAAFVRQSQDAGHLGLGLHVDDDLGYEAIETRVRSVGKQAQRICDDARDRDEGGHGVMEGAVFWVKHERLLSC